jgi:prevent-host-death family protein
MVVNIHEAKTKLSKLLVMLDDGEDIIIAKAGEPVAKIIPYKQVQKREAGVLKNKIHYSEDFDSSDDEVAKLFEDSSL